MVYVPGFSNDIFISYSHIDDQAVPGGVGWVTDFHQRFQIEIEEELGARVQIWRDGRIDCADDFSRELERQVRGSSVLLAVLSPGYRGSAWCEREAKGFVTGTLRAGDLWVETKCRLIKIAKRQTETNLVPETGALAFFDCDSATRHVYELEGGSEKYKRQLAHLAHEVGFILRSMRKSRSVFLGTASPILTEQRERVRRELEAREYRVVTSTASDDPGEIVRAAVKECSLSVLFDGRTDQPSDDPDELVARAERTVASEEGARQVVVMRDQAANRLTQDGVAQDDARPSPEARTGEGANVEWLVDPSPHALQHTVLQMLDSPAEQTTPQKLVCVYLICDRADHPLLQSNFARHLRDHLLQLGFEVKTPLAEEAEAGEFSRDNRGKLRQCDAVLLYWGAARQSWFEQRQRELMQARGWRRGRAFVAVAGYISDPENTIKQNFETRELDELIKQFHAFDCADARLTRFVQRLTLSV